jgi:hypothetical protein
VRTGRVDNGFEERGVPIQRVTRESGGGKRFVVRADEKLTAFVELEAAIRS